jgi:hypothetical protein
VATESEFTTKTMILFALSSGDGKPASYSVWSTSSVSSTHASRTLSDAAIDEMDVRPAVPSP